MIFIREITTEKEIYCQVETSIDKNVQVWIQKIRFILQYENQLKVQNNRKYVWIAVYL